jgi:predicted nuclease of predicted toxin-antitoxin system
VRPAVRILLDACVPRRIAWELPGHEIRAAPQMGWADLDDGPLLDAMAGMFDVLVTVDKSLPKKQRLNTRPFRIVILRATTNRFIDLVPPMRALRQALSELNLKFTVYEPQALSCLKIASENPCQVPPQEAQSQDRRLYVMST